MKVTREAPPTTFHPVFITLQSAAEVGILMSVIGPTSAFSRTSAYLERSSTHPDYPPMARATLEEASDALSDLYHKLKITLIDRGADA